MQHPILGMGRDMLGAIAGDIIGSIYEFNNIKTKDFPLFGEVCNFTDDSVLTVAVADCLLRGGDFAMYIRAHARNHPNAGYGGFFREWMQTEDGPYNSFGNGSAMRVSPVAHFGRDEAEVLELAKQSASATHNHPEGIKGAQSVALAMWMARSGFDIETIRTEVADRFEYDLSRAVDEIRPSYSFDVTCAGSVPEAIICALQASSYEDAVRNAISIGGDSDTIACISGGIAEMLFGVPEDIAMVAKSYLTDDLLKVVDSFLAHSK